MAAILDAAPRPAAWRQWLLVGAGLAALYVPVFYQYATGLWQSDDHAHGPIILAVIAWLVWRERAALVEQPARTAPAAGLPLLVFGLFIYIIGRSQDITIFETGALIPILAGTLLALRGWAGIRTFWFALLFVVFLIPLPGTFVDALTGPLKSQVSQIAEQLLYVAGYPVARNGVTLTVGQYQLLVADACSGLNSMFSLSALGLLYLYVMQRKGWVHNGIVIVSILPIAFVANIVRVLILVLITYHLGDEAGQGFLHGTAGIVLLLVALAILLAFDSILGRAIGRIKNAV